MNNLIFSSILSIRDKDNNYYDNYKLVYESNKFSNTKIPIYKISINDKVINRKNNLYIKYSCISCKSSIEITFNLFIRKINKNINKCYICKEHDDIKKQNQSLFMKENINNILIGDYIKKSNIVIKKNILEISKQKWAECDNYFKEKYLNHYLTENEFNNIKNKIISVQNNKILSLDNWIYLEYIYINNQTKFNPILYNSQENIFEKPLYIKLICENCDDFFTIKNLINLKNCNKILCKTCKFTNKTFKINYTVNIKNNKIRYQSKLELNFIKWCNENNILITNGPIIEYIINNKNKKYYLDFELNELNILLEMKDNHCWHKKQVENGIFESKNKYATEFAKKENKKFIVLFNKDVNSFKNKILNNYKI
jgi:hypothetical protein